MYNLITEKGREILKEVEKNINREKVVLILSGGMDSTTLLYDLVSQGYEVYAITFDYKQKHNREIIFAKATCDELKINHKILDLSSLNEVAVSALTRDYWDVPEGHYAEENMKQTVVPNRNMVMLSLAVSYAISLKCTKVFYGAHKGDHDIYPDCRKEFVQAMRNAVRLCDWAKIELNAPYLDMDKGDIAIRGKELKVDYSLTWTCYKGDVLACGRCGSCVERLEAFFKAGMQDPVPYKPDMIVCPNCKFTAPLEKFTSIKRKSTSTSKIGSLELQAKLECPNCHNKFWEIL